MDQWSKILKIGDGRLFRVNPTYGKKLYFIRCFVIEIQAFYWGPENKCQISPIFFFEPSVWRRQSYSRDSSYPNPESQIENTYKKLSYKKRQSS